MNAPVHALPDVPVTRPMLAAQLRPPETVGTFLSHGVPLETPPELLPGSLLAIPPQPEGDGYVALWSGVQPPAEQPGLYRQLVVVQEVWLDIPRTFLWSVNVAESVAITPAPEDIAQVRFEDREPLVAFEDREHLVAFKAREPSVDLEDREPRVPYKDREPKA